MFCFMFFWVSVLLNLQFKEKQHKEENGNPNQNLLTIIIPPCLPCDTHFSFIIPSHLQWLPLSVLLPLGSMMKCPEVR